VVIIWMKGVMVGWDHQAKTDMTNWEIGGGQYWHENYDPFDPFTLAESHSSVPEVFREEITRGEMEPMLIVQGTIYPQGRMQSVAVKGIRPEQKMFLLPTHKLDTATEVVPVIIGAVMARNLKLGVGDYLTLRWRDAKGTFDATETVITDIFSSNVPAIESGQIYLSLETLQEMTMLHGEATLLTFKDSEKERPAVDGWM